MNYTVLTVVVACLGVICLGAVAWLIFMKPRVNYRVLMGNGPDSFQGGQQREETVDHKTEEEIERIKKIARKKGAKRAPPPTFEEKMFRAGIFTEAQRSNFKRLQVFPPVFLIAVGLGIGFYMGGMKSILLSGFAGALLGVYIPITTLERRTTQRDEDILFFLPLVIEQIAIGVSSSLDIGPCISRVVQMADERDSHNAVTEIVRYAQYQMKSGLGLEEALLEVGKLAGHVELKHAFMALAQVAKFGGEVSKQLQELADSVSSQRESKLEAKIKKLELSATVPVALVFFGFLSMLLTGFMMPVLGKF